MVVGNSVVLDRHSLHGRESVASVSRYGTYLRQSESVSVD